MSVGIFKDSSSETLKKEIKNVFLQRYLAEKLSLKKMAGSPERISSTLAKSSIQLNPYQIYAVKFAFDSPLQRGAILADEVGLGKTIEAGIIIAQLWSEGKRQILIIAPASIRRQWQEELFIRFGLESIVIDTLTFKKIITEQNKIPFTYAGIFIVSYQFCYRNIELIEKQNWDCVIIDEAHRLRNVWRGRNSAKIAWSIREAFKNTPKLLLTATPLQNNLMELYGIVSFIDDKLLGTPYSFKKKFIEPLNQNINPHSTRLIQELRRWIKGEESENSNEKVSGVLVRTLRKQVSEYVKFTERKAFAQDFTPTDEEQELYEKVSAYLRRDKVAAIQSRQRPLMLLVYRKILASSSFAIANTLKRLIEYLEEELRLRTVYNSTILPKNESEESEYEDLIEEINVEDFEKARIKPRIDINLFSDEDIKREIDELKSYYNLALSIKKNAKGEALIKALHSVFRIAQEKNWPQKAVIFTESVRTQQYLKELLTQQGFKCTIFNGANNSKEAHQALKEWELAFPELAEKGTYQINIRQALVYEFETKTDVLIATEAGAEGLNLQFCNIVINYDLPWNPQRIEQRIGRCHRYGQKYDVLVVNFLNTKNRADQRVLELLQNKLHLFEGLFGASDEVLGLLESGIDFEKRILEIYQTCRTPEEIDKAFDELQRQIQDRLREEIKTLRSQILEYLDEPVRQLFKETAFETEKCLSEFDRDLLRLCKYFYGNELTPLNEEDKTYKFKD
ncbi:DEAD/DEAH box helicase family protein, partial [Candidatus Calescamantes bacterium]|nr:DEAD/DEAH box helicase family protein [Candidatus Calescamantes bacterium]